MFHIFICKGKCLFWELFQIFTFVCLILDNLVTIFSMCIRLYFLMLFWHNWLICVAFY